MAIVHNKNAISGIDITMYLVKDLDRAIRFWRDTMGLKLTWEYPAETGAEFSFEDGTTFGIYKIAETQWHPSGGVCFRVADINAAVEYYKERGAHFDGDGMVQETPVCFLAFGRDSEENTFILHQHKS